MGKIAQSMSKAIKEAKWLSIEYQNREGEKTSYWCAIKDINIEQKAFVVTMFNITKIDNENKGIIPDAFLRFDSIKKADIIDHTSYEQPIELIQKIEKNISILTWLNYDLYNEKTLDYIKECIKYDSIPYQKETALV